MKSSLRLLAAASIISFALPALAFAQSADLRATIKAELLKDPRSAQMSSTQVDAMVNVLSQQAAAQGLTPYDITWRPQDPNAPVTAQQQNANTNAFCSGMPQFICAINSGFGFDGSNTVIPIALFFTSGLLWFLLYELRHHHYLDAHAAAQANAMPPATPAV